MKIYADEFIQAMEIIEENIGKAIAELANELNKDFMIECRNISIGDSSVFGKEFFVNPKVHKLNVFDEIHSRKHTVDEISNAISKKVETYIKELIEKKIEESETPITRIKDIRKVIKVVVDQDVVIEFNSFDLCFKIGIEEYRNS